MRTGHRGGTQNENKVSRIPSTTQSRNTSSQSIQPAANKRRRAIDAIQSLVDKVTAPTNSSDMQNNSKKVKKKSIEYQSSDSSKSFESESDSSIDHPKWNYQDSIAESQTSAMSALSAPRSLRSQGGLSLSRQETLLNSLRGSLRVPQGFARDILADTDNIKALIGLTVKKLFGITYYNGKITEYFSESRNFHVLYEDNDEEDLSCHEVCEALRLYINV